MQLSARAPAFAGALVVAMLLGGLVPVLVLLSGGVEPIYPGGGAGETTVLLSACVLVLAGCRLGWLIGLGEPRLMEMSLWTFTYLFLGLSALVQFQTASFSTSTPWFDAAFTDDAMWAVLIGSAAALLGIHWATRRPAVGTPMLDLSAPMLNERRLYLLAAIGLVLNLYYLIQIGPATVLLSREELSAAQAANWPGIGLTAFVAAAAQLPLLVVFIGLLGANHQRAKRGDRPRYALLVLVGCVVLYSVNPISSPRYVSGTVILSMAAAMGAYTTPWRVRASATAFLGGLIFLFPLADAFRRQGEVQAEFAPMQALTSGDFDASIQISNSLDIIDQNGIEWGWQLLGVMLFWVPRDYWPNKPTATGTYIAEHMEYTHINISSPLIAEFLINGGWPLLILGMFGFGWWIRRRDNRMVQLGLLGGKPSVMGWILPFYLIILLRGSLLSAAVQFSVLWVTTWFIKDRSAAGAEREGRTSRQPETATGPAPAVRQARSVATRTAS
ncbi:hypothetical protein [Verrucosispora sp. FIM060022]|uniref:hypothetical protein n=1 Tax=Verrucosispora sp. FIM060022 TaxID=1479020 RepID=UPI000F872B33|nr:hypothetical protein [Verrucosispora sp. FIM060022]RUL92020.1 hypothetical protein EG812_18995 [Verrucosispora sp. FIM060022]